jgi:hypothetical protein
MIPTARSSVPAPGRLTDDHLDAADLSGAVRPSRVRVPPIGTVDERQSRTSRTKPSTRAAAAPLDRPKPPAPSAANAGVAGRAPRRGYPNVGQDGSAIWKVRDTHGGVHTGQIDAELLALLPAAVASVSAAHQPAARSA